MSDKVMASEDILRTDAESNCEHTPRRLWAWTAYDGTLCVACCDCGTSLRGAIDQGPNKGKK